jgi:hypothetical protein
MTGSAAGTSAGLFISSMIGIKLADKRARFHDTTAALGMVPLAGKAKPPRKSGAVLHGSFAASRAA